MLSGLVAGDFAICGRLAALILRLRPAGNDFSVIGLHFCYHRPSAERSSRKKDAKFETKFPKILPKFALKFAPKVLVLSWQVEKSDPQISPDISHQRFQISNQISPKNCTTHFCGHGNSKFFGTLRRGFFQPSGSFHLASLKIHALEPRHSLLCPAGTLSSGSRTGGASLTGLQLETLWLRCSTRQQPPHNASSQNERGVGC